MERAAELPLVKVEEAKAIVMVAAMAGAATNIVTTPQRVAVRGATGGAACKTLKRIRTARP